MLANGRIVAGDKLKPFGIENSDVGIKEGAAQSHTEHLCAESLALFEIDSEIIDILIIDHTIDHSVQVDLLGFGEIAVGFLLGNIGKGINKQGAYLGDAQGGAQADWVLTDSAIRSGFHLHLDGGIVHRGDGKNLNTRVVKHHFFGIGQPRPREN